MKSLLIAFLGTLLISGCAEYGNQSPVAAGPDTGTTSMTASYVLDHDADLITGETQSLKQYEGKVLLIVNVASKCGFTSQYEQLEALYKQHGDDGLVILGFPANNFGSQEPGSNEEIAEFCSATYGVSFPMFSKIDVVGEGAHSLYKDLSGQPEPIGGEPQWNFTKFLVNRQGEVVNRFDTRVSPDDEAVVSAISDLL